MNSLIESFYYCAVKCFGAFVRALPEQLAVGLGRFFGLMAYYFDIKHKSQVFANLKIAFADTKSPREIKDIAKTLFQNFVLSFIELMRLPNLDINRFDEQVHVQGREYALEALKQGKGLIMIAMHFGSWEIGSLFSATLGKPYKVIVKPQKKFSRLDELLNSYRQCGGTIVIERGMGSREIIKSLRKNEVVGMVVDQGGRDGLLVPFFSRQASMSVGAIRIGLKLGIPLCFAVIIREKGFKHRLIVHKPLELDRTGDLENDVRVNLKKVTHLMEHYISSYPTEYMWFYKIWKYSKESVTVILDDGKAGHLNQSYAVARMLELALKKRNIVTTTKRIPVAYKSKWAGRLMSVLCVCANDYIYQGRLEFMRWFLSQDSYRELMSIKADFIISCGASTAAVNYLLSNDQQAKSMVILKPGLLSSRRFDLVVMPQHDCFKHNVSARNVVVTKAAPNLMTREYLEEKSQAVLKRFSHLKVGDRLRIGLLLGGDTKSYFLSDKTVKLVMNQILVVAEQMNAEILVSTSRRTSAKVENMLLRDFKKNPLCRLLVIANRENFPEAVGGILGLSDIVVVSGDSISMISEAASSGKKTIVFPVQDRLNLFGGRHKHNICIELLNKQGHILSSDTKNIEQSLYHFIKNKIQTRELDDHTTIYEAVKNVI